MKRPRAGGFHVKTGCQTCKIRHVKCDEEKPSCNKCRSTGRICDGYKTKRSTSGHSQDNDVGLFPVDTTINALSNITSPIISIVGTDRERRSFAFFCYQVGHQLSTALKITKTHQLILQASHCDETVRSAVIALGSMGERLSINNLLTLENEQANACHEFATLQYYKALKRLRERISSDSEGSADLAILLCFLFAIFEFLQGNDTASLIHLRSGLNILRRDHGSPPTELRAVSPDEDPLTHEILRIFSKMDMQATIWLGLKTFQAPMMIPLDTPVDSPAHLDVFSTLVEASDCLKFQILFTYHFQRLIAASDCAGFPTRVPPELHVEREKLISQLIRWYISLEALIKKLRKEIDPEISQRIVVLKMNYEITLMILTACLQPSGQQIYADHEINFRTIVTLARSIVGSTSDVVKLKAEHMVGANRRGINPAPMFSFYSGVIQPLYFTAIKCQNLDICQEAIALLSSSPWREGAWDSATMARIAARRVREDKGMSMDTELPITGHVAYSNTQREYNLTRLDISSASAVY